LLPRAYRKVAVQFCGTLAHTQQPYSRFLVSAVESDPVIVYPDVHIPIPDTNYNVNAFRMGVFATVGKRFRDATVDARAVIDRKVRKVSTSFQGHVDAGLSGELARLTFQPHHEIHIVKWCGTDSHGKIADQSQGFCIQTACLV
jgi:hypothetical protein